MSYHKTDPQPAGLHDGETALELDTGDLVAVCAHCSVQSETGNPVITARARAINADGTDKLDANGAPMHTSFVHTSCAAEAEQLTMPVLMRSCVMAVLGEPTAPLLDDPIHATALSHASIRTNLASAKHAGAVDVSAIL